MAPPTLAAVLQFLRTECAAGELEQLADGLLLERFLVDRDEAAFAALVHRHGAMVLGVCRRVLGDIHHAEDAFQATFLVLVRRAAALRRDAPLGPWLYGVAQRVALKARAKAAARQSRQRKLTDMPTPSPLDDLTWRELRAVLDEEVARLPEKCRAPIVLCYFQGKSYDQAAVELGCPKSSLASRLARGRDLLRQRLVQRGIALSAGALTTVLAEQTAGASVTALLTINMAKAAACVAAGKTVADGLLSAQAFTLAEEAMKTTIGIKAKLVLLVLVLGLAVGAGYAGYGAWVEQPPPKENGKPAPVAKERPAKKDTADPTKGRPDPAGWRHDGQVRFAAFLPDGKQLVTASSDGIIRVWEYPAGKEIHKFTLPAGSVKGMLALSTDGKMIAAAKLDETEIYLHDLATGKQQAVLKWTALEEKKLYDIDRLAFSPNGEHLAALDRAGVVSIWDWAKGKEIHKFASGEGLHGIGLAYAPDGKSIVTINKKKNITSCIIKIWDPATGKEKGAIEKLGMVNLGMVLAVSFSPDSKSLAICVQGEPVGSAQDYISWSGGIAIVDIATGKQIRQRNPVAESFTGKNGLVFGKDGAKVYIRTFGTIVEYEVITGKVLRHHQLPRRVGNISLSPDGSTLLAPAGMRPQFFDLSGKEIASLIDYSDPPRSAVQLVEKLGGKVERDDKHPGKPVIGVRFSGFGFERVSMTDADLKVLKEFKQLTSLLIENHKEVTGVGLSELKELKQLTSLKVIRCQGVTDAGVKELTELKQLTSLDLSGCRGVTDAGVKGLKELKQLTFLSLHGTQVANEGLKELKELKQLKELKLIQCDRVTDEGLKQLKELKQLTTLSLDYTSVTGVGLSELKELKQLTSLGLRFAKVTDEGLKELKKLKQLTKLYIGGTQVTDEGLKELKELKKLTTLGLGATKVTDKGLKELKELKQLQELILIRCEVTDAGVKELQKALPKCKIIR